MLDLLEQFKHFVLHLPEELTKFTAEHGPWVYALLFAIVFCETGLVIAPFLPGDSLLFAAGVIAYKGKLSAPAVGATLVAAATLGDSLNYFIGSRLSKRVASGRRIPLVKPKHIERTHAFFEKYGPKAIILGRFVPVVRTFTPFVAGVGRMGYPRFLAYSFGGSCLWVFICVGAGYAFATNKFVNEHFEAVILAVVAVSLVPMIIEAVLARRRKAAQAAADRTNSPPAP
jgi:membrane-associated protein